jgi:hypothetical protein
VLDHVRHEEVRLALSSEAGKGKQNLYPRIMMRCWVLSSSLTTVSGNLMLFRSVERSGR